MEYYLAIKKNEIMKFASKWMKLQNIIMSELSRPRKTNTTCSFSFVVSGSKLSDMNRSSGVMKIKRDPGVEWEGALKRSLAGCRLYKGRNGKNRGF